MTDETTDETTDEEIEEPAPITWPMVIELVEPIQAHGETLTQVELQRPRMKHIEARDGASGQANAGVRIIAAIAGIPPSSVKEMVTEDFGAIESALRPFLAPLQE